MDPLKGLFGVEFVGGLVQVLKFLGVGRLRARLESRVWETEYAGPSLCTLVLSRCQ